MKNRWLAGVILPSKPSAFFSPKEDGMLDVTTEGRWLVQVRHLA
ncbi:hypothetical protein [Pendulispora rubella]